LGLVQRQSFWNTVIAYLGVAIGFVNAMILFPRFLDDDQVGLTRILQQAAVIFSQFAALGGNNICLRFFPFFRNQHKHDGFAFYTFRLTTIGCLVFAILIFIFKNYIVNYYDENSPLFVDYFLMLIPIGIATTYFNLFDSHARSVFRTIVPSFIKDVLLRLLITISISCYALGWLNFESFVILFVVMNSVIALVLFLFLVAKKEIHIRAPIKISNMQRKEMLQYGFYSLITGTSNILVITIDSLMIGAIMDNGLQNVAYYTTAAFLISLMTLPARSMEKITYPLIAEFWKQNQLEKINKLYKKVSVTNAVICFMILILLWTNVRDLYSFLPAPYSLGIICVLWLGIGRLIDMMTGINSIIIKTSEHYRYETLFNIIFTTMAVALNYFFIPLWGMQGAAIATGISIVVFNLLKCGFIYFKIGLWPFEKNHFWIILLGSAVLIAGYYLPLNIETDSWFIHAFNIGVRSLFALLVFALPVYLLKWSEDINEIVNKIFGKMFLKK